MKTSMRASVRSLVLVGLGMLLIAGCPMTSIPLDTFDNPDPGSYYVEQQDGKLYYFKLATSEDTTNEWVELPMSNDWYEGPGFYVIDEAKTWSVDENAENLTLDEFLQLYDPAPPAAS